MPRKRQGDAYEPETPTKTEPDVFPEGAEQNGHYDTNRPTPEVTAEVVPLNGHAEPDGQANGNPLLALAQRFRKPEPVEGEPKRLPNPMQRAVHSWQNYSIELKKPLFSGTYHIKFGEGTLADKPMNEEIIPALKAVVKEFCDENGLNGAHGAHWQPALSAWTIRKVDTRENLELARKQDAFIDEVFDAIGNMEEMARGPKGYRGKEVVAR